MTNPTMQILDVPTYLDALRALREELLAEFPRVQISEDLKFHCLEVRTPMCSGVVDLQVHSIDDSLMKPKVSIGSGAALCGSLDVVQSGLNDYQAVVDTLRVAAKALELILVRA
jgi:hypothetical protein